MKINTKINTVEDIVNWRLCVGCGACVAICPYDKLEMVNIVEDGLRPILGIDDCYDCNECIKVCPGIEVDLSRLYNEEIEYLSKEWGPIKEIREGYAADEKIRYYGSSGGAASAIALYCLENEGIDGVIHVGPDIKNPLLNKTYISKNKTDILNKTGSRYSPASPCEGLRKINNSDGKYIFIGKPCDVAGLRKYMKLKPEIKEKIFCIISIFCAGTPSTKGTLELLKKLEISPDEISGIRYRGMGWPGDTVIKTENGKRFKLSYKESWGFINKYRPYRCYLCPDGTGELADISCGDPWYRNLSVNEKGASLILARTQKGKDIISNAFKYGYINLIQKHDKNIIMESQKQLYNKKCAIWGRLIAFKILGIPNPNFKGYTLFENWKRLPAKEKIKSILGTLYRIIKRKYYRKYLPIQH